jgi:hypothetical protein
VTPRRARNTRDPSNPSRPPRTRKTKRHTQTDRWNARHLEVEEDVALQLDRPRPVLEVEVERTVVEHERAAVAVAHELRLHVGVLRLERGLAPPRALRVGAVAAHLRDRRLARLHGGHELEHLLRALLLYHRRDVGRHVFPREKN